MNLHAEEKRSEVEGGDEICEMPTMKKMQSVRRIELRGDDSSEEHEWRGERKITE